MITLRICPKCGVNVLDDEAKFCIECGANLSAEKSSAVSVAKGQRVDLTKTNPSVKNLLVGLGWRAADGFDIDAAAFLLGANGKVLEETDFIFYNNPLHDSESVEHFGDETVDGDNEQFRVALDKIPSSVAKIAFTLTIHDAAQRRQSFGQVNDTFIRVADETSELLRYNLGKNFSAETAIVVAEIYRHKNDWKFNAIGSGFSGGLAALCRNFGIDVA